MDGASGTSAAASGGRKSTVKGAKAKAIGGETSISKKARKDDEETADFLCPLCDMAASALQELEMHIQSRHSDRPTRRCRNDERKQKISKKEQTVSSSSVEESPTLKKRAAAVSTPLFFSPAAPSTAPVSPKVQSRRKKTAPPSPVPVESRGNPVGKDAKSLKSPATPKVSESRSKKTATPSSSSKPRGNPVGKDAKSLKSPASPKVSESRSKKTVTPLSSSKPKGNPVGKDAKSLKSPATPKVGESRSKKAVSPSPVPVVGDSPSSKPRSNPVGKDAKSVKSPPATPKLSEKEQADKRRRDKWKKSLADNGTIACEHEGCTVELTTVSGMVYHHKSCRVFKERQKLLAAQNRPLPVASGPDPAWQRPDDVKPVLTDLFSLSLESMCAWSPAALNSLTAEIDVKCPRCAVRLSTYLLAAMHYKSCNPYGTKTSGKIGSGYSCAQCGKWYYLKRELDVHAQEHKKVNTDEVVRTERYERWRTVLADAGHIKCEYQNCDAELKSLSDAKHHYNTCKVQRQALGAATQAMLAEKRAAARLAEEEAADKNEEGGEEDDAKPEVYVDGRGRGPTDQFSAEQMAFWKHELAANGLIKCLTPNCPARLKSMTAIKYHVKVCYVFTKDECTCRICDKVLDTPRHLGAHVRTHERNAPNGKVKPEKGRRSSSMWDNETVSMHGRRKSAMKCLSKGFTEKDGSGEDSDEDDTGRSSLEFSPVDLPTFQKMLEDDGHATCQLLDCRQQFDSLSRLKEHYRAQHSHLLVIPRNIKRKRSLRDKSRDEVFRLHQADMDDAVKSEEEDDDAAEGVSDSDSEPHDDRPAKRHYPSRGERTVFFDPWSAIGKKIHHAYRRSANVAKGENGLFEQLTCASKDWSAVSESQVTEYLSVVDEVSPPFCCAGDGDTVRRQPCFSSMLYERRAGEDATHAALYVGGAPWAMKWCPSPEWADDAEQYLMVSSKRCTSVTRQSDMYAGKGMLQFWSCGVLSGGRLEQAPSVALTVCHDYGFVWDAVWCPSGVWQDPSRKKKKADLPRLGLLAIAASSGFVGVLSIPHPSHLPKYSTTPSPHAYRVKACTRLSYARSSLTPSAGQALGVAWHPKNPHRYLAVSFALGCVCVWDLSTSSPLLQVSSDSGPVLYSQKMMQAECSAVRSLSWCPTNDNLLAAGFQDASFHIWDVSNPTYPVFSVQLSGPATVISWLPHWPCILVGIDGSLGLHGDCLYAVRWKWDEICHGKRPIQVSSGITMSISGASSNGVVAVGNAHGKVSLVSLPPPSCAWPYNVGTKGLKSIEIRCSKGTPPPEATSAASQSLDVDADVDDVDADVDVDGLSVTSSAAGTTGLHAGVDKSSSLRYAGQRAFSVQAGSHMYLAEGKAKIVTVVKQHSSRSKSSTPVLYTDITASLMPAVLQVEWNAQKNGWLATATASGIVLLDYHRSVG